MVPRVHRGIISALNYAKSLDPEAIGLHVAISDRSLPEVQRLWSEYAGDTPLMVLRSPFRSLLEPVLEYVDRLREEHPERVVTVIVPEAVSTRWWHKLLQENVANQLKAALGSRRGVVVSNVRYFLD
jgi:hypothetical protein